MTRSTSTFPRMLRVLGWVLAATAAPALGRAEAKAVWLDVNLASRHSERRYFWQGTESKFHEKNFGLGATYEVNRWLEAKAGWFENSYEKTSGYGLLNAKWKLIEQARWSLAPGLAGGVVSGYKNTPEQTGTLAPWGMLTLAVTVDDRWRVNLGYVPSRVFVSNSIDVATLQVSLKL